MNTQEQRLSYMHSVISDSRLKPIHIALATALCFSSDANPFHISRRELMLKSRIRSKATYHKVIKDLIRFHYIQYAPSYHPVQASEIKLLFPETNQNVSLNETIHFCHYVKHLQSLSKSIKTKSS